MKKIFLILLLIPSLCFGANLSKWDGITVGTSAGNINKINGTTLGTSAGNFNAWNGLTISTGGAACNCTSGCTFIGFNVTSGGADDYGDAGYVFGPGTNIPGWQTGSGDAGKQVCEISAYVHYGSTATYQIRTAMYSSLDTAALIADTVAVTVSNSTYAWVGAMDSSQINGGTPVYVAASTFYKAFVYIDNNDTRIYTSTGESNCNFDNHPVSYLTGFPTMLSSAGNGSTAYSVRIGYK